MSLRATLSLALLGLAAVLAVAFFQTSPGYMDAEYYYAGGVRLAQGHGFSEMILWNYLDDPSGLPHPSHGYWMPLASLLASLGMVLSGVIGFSTARIGFLALSAALPPLTAALSFSLNGRKEAAMLSGLLAVTPAFYLAYLPTTDAFGLYMLLGGTFLLVAGQQRNTLLQPSTFNLQPLLLGLLAGLMHLTRADGLLWLFLAFIAVFLPEHGQKDGSTRFAHLAARLAACLAGYLLIMGPWLVRNLTAFGAPLAPGGARALWINAYDQLYTYPAEMLSAASWRSAGASLILRDRLWALGQNMQTALAVQTEIFLLPLILLGLWRLRGERRVKLGSLAWLLTLAVMTAVFPYAGARGGFFHSGAALQPLFFALVPAGLDSFLAWMRRVRGWNASQAWPVFALGLVVISVLLAVSVVWGRVVGPDPAHPVWGAENERYARLEKTLQGFGARPGEIALVNNAPGYFVASGRPSISIPYGSIPTLLAVAGRYGARYLLLEVNQIEDLYLHPEGRPGLEYLGSVEATRIFRIQNGNSP